MKRLGYIFISILAILLMSHNTFAYSEFGQGFERDYSASLSAMVWYEYAGGGWHSDPAINTNGAIAFATSNADAVRNVNRFYLRFTADTFDGGKKYIIYLPFRYCVNNPDELKSFIGFNGNGFSNIVSQEAFNVNGYCIEGHLTILYQPNTNTKSFYLGSGNDNGSIIGEVYDGFSMVFNKATIIPVIGDDIPTADEIADAVNGQQETAGEAQSEAAQDAADDSQDSVDSATTSLFSAIGSVITAIKDTNATDCVIDITTAQYTIGNVNLCQAPQGILTMVQALAALVIVPMVLKASYSLLHKMYNAFKEVQDT